MFKGSAAPTWGHLRIAELHKLILKYPSYCLSLYFTSGHSPYTVHEASSVCVSLPWCALCPGLWLWMLSFLHSPFSGLCGRRQHAGAAWWEQLVPAFPCSHLSSVIIAWLAYPLPSGGLLSWMCRWRVVLFLNLLFQASCMFMTKKRKGSSAVILVAQLTTGMWFCLDVGVCWHLCQIRPRDAEFTLPLCWLWEADNSWCRGSASCPPRYCI